MFLCQELNSVATGTVIRGGIAAPPVDVLLLLLIVELIIAFPRPLPLSS